MLPTHNLHVKESIRLIAPRELKAQLPMTEAANTTVALQMMQKSGFLKFHVVDQPTMRGLPFGTFGLVHATATIKEIADGHLWVVDTWYKPSGGPSYVVDRGEWRGGWSPPSDPGT